MPGLQSARLHLNQSVSFVLDPWVKQVGVQVDNEANASFLPSLQFCQPLPRGNTYICAHAVRHHAQYPLQASPACCFSIATGNLAFEVLAGHGKEVRGAPQGPKGGRHATAGHAHLLQQQPLLAEHPLQMGIVSSKQCHNFVAKWEMFWGNEPSRTSVNAAQLKCSIGSPHASCPRTQRMEAGIGHS
eukprot:1159801-Pelagomonas_calceolata.AAC.7